MKQKVRVTYLNEDYLDYYYTEGQEYMPRVEGGMILINTFSSDGTEMLDLFPVNAISRVTCREIA